MHRSSKLFDGFSTVFRQHRAFGTHCFYLHGYAVSFRLHFAGELDDRNWVFDFGGMKRAKQTIKTAIGNLNPKDWMDYMFDHTTIVAEDDPLLETFKGLDEKGMIQLRVLDATGAERFAQYIYDVMSDFVHRETEGRVKLEGVEFMENAKNVASYWIK